MKPRANFIINAACLFLVSPLLGMLVAGLVVGILEALMWTVACVAGLVIQTGLLPPYFLGPTVVEPARMD